MRCLSPRRSDSVRTRRAVRRANPSLEGFEARLLLSTVPAPTAVISGTTYRDTDGDDSKNSVESGVTVDLFKAGATTPTATAVTNSSGNYSFTKLATGNYVVKEVPPKGWVQTNALSGYTVDLTKNGQTVSNQDFSNFDAPLYSSSAVSGISYVITTPAGASTKTTSLAGVKEGDKVKATFSLSKVEPVWLVSYTAPNGTFNTANLQKQVVFQESEAVATNNDTETVTVTIPNGYFQLDLVAGPVIGHLATNANIEYHPQGRFIAGTNGGTQVNGASSISGVVETTPAKGQKTGTFLADVPVTLSGYDYTGKEVKETVKTNAQGVFSFAGLVASNPSGYRITVDLPTASAIAGSTGGSIDSKAKFLTTFLNTNTSSMGNIFYIAPANA